LPPSAREVYQHLRDVAQGVRLLHVVSRTAAGEVCVAIDGWSLTLLLDVDGLAGCLRCHRADGGLASLADWPRYGTNPTDFLSLWERQRLEALLTAR